MPVPSGPAPATATTPARQDAAPAAPGADMDIPLGPVVMLGALFLGTIVLSLALAPTFDQEVGPVFEDTQSLANPIWYLGLVLVFTLVILLIARFGKKWLIQAIVLGAVFMTMVYVFWPLGSHYVGGSDDAWLLGGCLISAALTLLLYFHPEWYVIDATGVVVGVGATALFGISFGLLPALLLLVAFAVYDFVAVYRTKHMIDLADAVLSLRLPVMLVAPKVRGYSFLKERGLKERLEKKEGRDALFMGLGDVVIPGVLVVSAFHFLKQATPRAGDLPIAPHLLVALATLAGATAGFGLLMWAVMKGRPHAGLPSLNGGAILAFLVATLAVYGSGPLLP